MKLKSITIDAKANEEGVWIDELPGYEDLRLKVRPHNNPDWRRLQSRLIQQLPMDKRIKGRIDSAEMDRINAICLLNTILLDWENIVDEKTGEAVPYSKDQAKVFLTDPRYMADFGEAVMAAAVAAKRGNDAEREEAEKNL